MKPVMQAIAAHPALELQVLAAGTMVLERFQQPVKIVRQDGFDVHGEIYMELAAALAAAYMNLCIAHIQGGEVSGSIDESARHAISKFAHYHFPSTARSAVYLQRMGERPDTILAIGCPSSDIARCLDCTLTPEVVNTSGSGAYIDVSRPFLLVVFHPTTTEYGSEYQQMEALLTALNVVQCPTIVLWPNIDAGSDHVSKAIRVLRDLLKPTWLRTLTNLEPEQYLKVLTRTACAVGNSSSFVRDAGFFGTPVVLVGRRQDGRERDEHVTPVPPETDAIVNAIRAQLAHGRYAPSTLYGDGRVAARLADALARLTPYVQKRLHYIVDEAEQGTDQTVGKLALAHAAANGAPLGFAGGQ
jgi:UDP-hydrolysing UDP-N-acetyl-D-glucosamine 2-epimerase